MTSFGMFRTAVTRSLPERLTVPGSDAVTVLKSSRVRLSAGPVSRHAGVLPGRVEAEDFDTSPKEKAYWDFDENNNGGAYRQTGVDIQDCLEGGYNLGWIETDEWLEYTVDVQEAGKYDIVCRTGSPNDGAKLHVEFDGVDQDRDADVVNTGDWQNYTHLIKKDVQLKRAFRR